MSCWVSFTVSCSDTRLGFHVRVVGSCDSLGGWEPAQGLPLHTSASDFPTWRAREPVSLPQHPVIEYKYIICDSDGGQVSWEGRPNRNVDLAGCEGWITIQEAFNYSDEPDEVRFRPLSSTLHPSSHKLTTLAEEGADFFEPTKRGSLCHSISVSSDKFSVPSVRSFSRLFKEGDQCEGGGPHTKCDEMPNDMLAREESCSNLFTAPSDEMAMNSFQFTEKYSLIGNGPLGEGTFGLVWRCTPNTQTDGIEKAAKIVRKARLFQRDRRNLLGEDGEIKTHMTLKHPHIVTLFEFFDEVDNVTLVLEYCRGGDLFDSIVMQSRRTGRGGYSEQASAIVTTHVLSALAYIHGRSVVHRDIKCENVLLAHVNVPVEQNIFKLCDFGFAAHDRGRGLHDRLGSPDTVAPEVVAGRQYSTPVDLWSAGVLIYMSLSAKTPFCAPTDQEVLRRVRTGCYSVTGDFWDSVSMPPKKMITALMVVDPQLRPAAEDAMSMEWVRNMTSLSASGV